MKNRFVRWAFMLLIGFGIGSTIGYFQAQQENEQARIEALGEPGEQNAATIIRKASAIPNSNAIDIGGEFELTDHEGNTVTQDAYKDSYKLIFFGFTYCPAICPTELQKVTLIMNELGTFANDITPIFITVDPERDTVDVMKQYVEQFHPKLVGLTGTEEQTEAVKKAFRVYATKVENDMMAEYMVDHSAFLYLMDKDNKLIALYPSTDTANFIAEDIKKMNLGG